MHQWSLSLELAIDVSVSCILETELFVIDYGENNYARPSLCRYAPLIHLNIWRYSFVWID